MIARAGILGVMLVLALGTPAHAQPTVPPTTRTQDCTTSGCHAKQLNHTFLHGPTAVQACDACHDYADPAKHTFDLKRRGRDLCDFCHIDKGALQGPVVHEPVTKGECTGCHDAHGSESRKMLKKNTTAELCAECHKTTAQGKFQHTPVAEDCLKCHSPHASKKPKLLSMDARPLCLSCHEPVAKELAASPHPHKPATEDCSGCHSPHASDHPAILKDDPAALCLSCHKEVGETISGATHAHTAVSDARACLNCHVAHASDHAKQLTKDPVAACMTCHAKPIKLDDARTIAPTAELAAPGAHKHGPIEKGDCAACHTVHGGTLDHLLTKPYSPDFYQPFSDEAYALCFSCHDAKLAEASTPEPKTRFRDGTRNLHAVHVMLRPQGRSCRTCHATHASTHERLIAESVTYGQWKLPIMFTPTAGGGSCSPGCHKPERYDREHPVRPAGSAPPPSPTAHAPGSAATQPPAPTAPK